MPKIVLEMHINASPEIVFDLSRSIDIHKLSTAKTGEEAIGGKTSGLMELHDTVEWKAKHLGIWQKLSTEITAYKRPEYFTDEMLKGAFNSFIHEHHFKKTDYGCLMTDIFNYKSPFGILGKLADFLFLKKYMTNFLFERNNVIKQVAESGKWKEILS